MRLLDGGAARGSVTALRFVTLTVAAFCLLLAGPLTLPGAAKDAQPVEVTVGTDEVVLQTQSGTHRFTIEMADDPMERARGLMFREDMARDHGMLFDFGGEDLRSFWMKNTPLPLDIIFVKADGTVVSIAENTTPFSTDPIDSAGTARFVFEVNAGVSEDIGLMPGDRLHHPRVERQP
ncbi:MAG: DUF192 domain-containing protein [Pseudomonadota bacterium]